MTERARQRWEPLPVRKEIQRIASDAENNRYCSRKDIYKLFNSKSGCEVYLYEVLLSFLRPYSEQEKTGPWSLFQDRAPSFTIPREYDGFDNYDLGELLLMDGDAGVIVKKTS